MSDEPAGTVAGPEPESLATGEPWAVRGAGRTRASKTSPAVQRLNRLQRIAAALSAAALPADVADVVLAELAAEVGRSSQAIWLFGQPTGLRLLKASGTVAAVSPASVAVEDDLPVALAVRSGQAVYVGSRAEGDRRFGRLTGSASARSFAVLPLVANGGALGALAIGFAQERAFEPEERAFLAAVAGQAAQALDRARLRQAEAAAGERLRFLAEASVTLAGSLDYHETLSRVARLTVPSITDLATVHVRDGAGVLRRVALAHRDPAVERAMRAYPDEQGYEVRSASLAAAATRGQALLLTDARPFIPDHVALDAKHSRILESLRIRSGIAVPLVARGEDLGMLSLMRVGESDPYTPDDRSFAEELARRAAVAIDNARLHTRGREISRMLQQSLLPPRLPAVPHVELAAAYHPAGEGLDVGGDFYDVFVLPGGRWGLIVGDVCGTGAAAAALTAQVRHTARGAARAGLDPVRVAAVVNEALIDTVADDEFCTLVYAQATPGPSGTDLTVVRAGHPAPVVVRADASLESLAPPGAVLGALPELSWQAADLHLSPGDAVVLVTDGVLETRRRALAGEWSFFGAEELARVLWTAAGQPAAALVSAIERAVLTFDAGRLYDDVAILALRAAPAGGS